MQLLVCLEMVLLSLEYQGAIESKPKPILQKQQIKKTKI